MGTVVVIEVGQPARIVKHDGARVELADLHRYTACDCVDARSLGTPPGHFRVVDVWFDDNGLLKADSVPNRRIGPNTIICGQMVLCARDEEGYSLPFTDEEAADVLAFVEANWAQLPASHPKPEPRIEFVTLPRRGSS